MLKKVIVLNDTRTSSHPGCHLVMEQIEKKCVEFGLQIIKIFKTNNHLLANLKREISKTDVIIINGEGSMHDDQSTAELLCQAAELAYCHGKPTYLINTVWEKNSEISRMLKILSGVFSRESFSNASLSKQGCISSVVPDLIFSCDIEDLLSEKKKKIVPKSKIIVIDNVRQYASLQLAEFAQHNSYSFYRMSSRPSIRSFTSIYQWLKLFAIGGIQSQLKVKRLNIFNNVEIVVTGRFHGACLAIMAGRPFIAISSNTHKIEGLIRDANLGKGAIILNDEQFTQNIDSALHTLMELMNDQVFLTEYKFRCKNYVYQANVAINSMFLTINK